jgi:hypothetical protein
MTLNCKSLTRAAVVRALAAASLCAAAAGAIAQPVVVGAYDPATRQSLAFYDVLVSSFADGTRITKMYTAYSTISQSFYLVRGGRQPNGAGCRREVFRLVPVAGNRLAIADPVNKSLPWIAKPIPTKIYATFDCTSFSCMDCISSDDPLGAGTSLEEPSCVCNPNLGASASGECTTTKPGLGGPYGPGEIVVQTPF